MNRHSAITVSENEVIIIDQNNVHVEQLIRSVETDETFDEFAERVQHRINWLDTH